MSPNKNKNGKFSLTLQENEEEEHGRTERNLTQMGMRTDLRYLYLIDETKKWFSFESTFSRPQSHKAQIMCSASEGGPLVKDYHLRSVPEQHDKNIHLTQTLDKDFPKTEDRYRVPANSLKTVDKILDYTPVELVSFRKLQNWKQF
jgi:hypothetical protein